MFVPGHSRFTLVYLFVYMFVYVLVCLFGTSSHQVIPWRDKPLTSEDIAK